MPSNNMHYIIGLFLLHSSLTHKLSQACCQDPRCQRLKLTDLLVAPLQHCTKLPLLLSNIRKYTEVEDEVQKLTESIARVEMSLRACLILIKVFNHVLSFIASLFSLTWMTKHCFKKHAHNLLHGLLRSKISDHRISRQTISLECTCLRILFCTVRFMYSWYCLL